MTFLPCIYSWAICKTTGLPMLRQHARLHKTNWLYFINHMTSNYLYEQPVKVFPCCHAMNKAAQFSLIASAVWMTQLMHWYWLKVLTFFNSFETESSWELPDDVKSLDETSKSDSIGNVFCNWPFASEPAVWNTGNNQGYCIGALIKSFFTEFFNKHAPNHSFKFKVIR